MNRLLYNQEEIETGVFDCVGWIYKQFNEYEKKKILLAPIMDGGLSFYSQVAEKLIWGHHPVFDYQSI